MKKASIPDLLNAQRFHYGGIRCKEDEIMQWVTHLRSQLEAGHEKIRLRNSIRE